MFWGGWVWIACGLACLIGPVYVAIEAHRTNKVWEREVWSVKPRLREIILTHFREHAHRLPPVSLWKAAWFGWRYTLFNVGLVGGGALLVAFS
jgi:hypothetical protein